MNTIFKIIFISIFVLFSLRATSQNVKREQKEIRNIMKFLSSNNSKIHGVFNLINDTLYIKKSFSSYKVLYDYLLSMEDTDRIFAKNSPLTKSEKIKFEKIIQKDEFVNSNIPYKNLNIKIISDSSIKRDDLVIYNITKPIFFRNFKLCLISIYSKQHLTSFFLKKKENTWIFYQDYVGYIN